MPDSFLTAQSTKPEFYMMISIIGEVVEESRGWLVLQELGRHRPKAA
jgi:hypothetical protein